ncbi:MAG: hypothetical protein LBQ44_04410 [Treponema sp.]|jgi:hypothetical protein|nr:hypothetical protein [Treponema sp.]
MRKEKQIGIRVGLPVFFTLELEDIYKHASGAHRALAFPDFCGFLIGLGLEAYRKTNRQEQAPEIPAAPDEEPWGEGYEPDGPFRTFHLAREEA